MKKALFALIILLVAGVSHAAIIWDNGSSTPSNYGANFSEGNSLEADDFILNSFEVLRSVQFWGSHWISGNEPAVEAFDVFIYANQSGNIGNLLGSSSLALITKIDTGYDHNNYQGANILEFTMDLVNPIDLAPGSYWFSVVSQDNPNTNFAWQETGLDGSGNFQRSYDGGNSWYQGSNSLAFNISNDFAAATPEPSSYALMLIGLLGLVAFGRRQRAQQAA